MKYSLKVGLLFLLAQCLAGCYSTLQMRYYPNANNVPLLQEKNEFKGTIMPTNFQTAYGVTDHFEIMLNGQDNHLWGATEEDRIDANNSGWPSYKNHSTEYWDCKIIEGGVGYFTKMKNNKPLEFYAGYGMGQTLTDLRFQHLSMNFNKVFLQSAYGWGEKKSDYILSGRISYVNFYNFHPSNLDTTNGMLLNSIQSFQPSKFNSLFFEPAFTFRSGSNLLKFHLQLGLSIPIIDGPTQTESNNLTYIYQVFNLNLGLSINLAPRFNKYVDLQKTMDK